MNVQIPGEEQRQKTESRQVVERWADLHRCDPHLRQRDGAARLGITEAELVAAHVGDGAVRLRPEWPALLRELDAIGQVTALSRNEHAVIEKVGRYSKVEVQGPMGQVLDPGIDLRLFLSQWNTGFALTEQTGRGPRHSLQFFNAFGTAIHKVFLGQDSDIERFHALVARHRNDDQTPAQVVQPSPRNDLERPDRLVDAQALREGWAQLEDTHDFVRLLRRLGIARTQALRLARPTWAEPVGVSSHRTVLEHAAATELSIMVFVGNPGIIQIHSGPVTTVKCLGGWFNVLDPGFNLHLKEEGVATAWVVRKPTRDGTVSSLELYDAAGEMIAYLFGKRKLGQPEQAAWRAILAALERSEDTSAAS